MEHCRLSYKNSSISYYRFGKGNKVAVCFHGYGEESESFTFLEKYAGDQFTFYAIDLPFHGQTAWHEGLNFRWEYLRDIIQEIVNAKRHIILLGFSLGGRVALSLYQAIPEKIEKLVLLAPDGLKVNFWYWLVTQTRAGNKIFHYTMKHPGWFLGFLKVLNRLGLLNQSIYKFTLYYIHDKKVRNDLYNRWTSLRRLRPDIEKIKSLIKNCKTPVRLIYGKYDKIILSARGEKFRKGIEDDCSLSIIDAGHQVLHEKHVKEIIESLKV